MKLASTRSLTHLLAAACIFTVGLACAADPPPPPAPPIILDTTLPPDGVPDVLARLLGGGWIFQFDVGQSPDGWGISSFHVRDFGGKWKPGKLGGSGEGGGAGWTVYSVDKKGDNPKTVGFINPGPPSGGTFGSFTFLVSGDQLPTSADMFKYRFDFSWQDATGAWYNTEFLQDGTLVGGTTHSIPEPATSAMIFVGLIVAGWQGISRQRKARAGTLSAATPPSQQA